jgi:hypothetical protein
MPIPVASRSKAWIRGRSLAGIAGSNPASSMDVCLLWLFCVVRGLLRLADHPPRGMLQCVVCLSVISKPEQRGGLDPAMKWKQIHAASFLFDYLRHDRCWQLALPKLVKELPAFLKPKSSLLLLTTARHYTVPEPCVSPLHLHTHCSLISLLMLSFCTLRSLLVYYVWIFQLMCFTTFLFLSSVLHVWSISAF